MTIEREASLPLGNKRNFYKSIEILRGLCALEVFIWHIFAHVHPRIIQHLKLSWLYNTLFHMEELSIMTFFIISGFVVTSSFHYYRERMGGIAAIPVFLAARAIRIWSLTIPVSLVSFFLTWGYRSWAGDYTKWSRFYHEDLLWASALGYSREWNGSGWTLLFELYAYILVPFLLLAMLSRGLLVKIISLLIFFIIAYGQMVVFQMDVKRPFVPLMLCFLLGMCLYLFRTIRFEQRTGIIMAFLGFVFMIVLAQIQVVSYDNLPLKVFACATVFVGVLSISRVSGRASTYLLLLGACSYSLYLWHWPILYFGNFFGNGSNWVQTKHQSIIFLCVQIPLCVIVSWLSYSYIERYSKMSFLMSKFPSSVLKFPLSLLQKVNKAAK
jgi:peptidoglycan/LPS O-acetylase OafA/YrhL